MTFSQVDNINGDKYCAVLIWPTSESYTTPMNG